MILRRGPPVVIVGFELNGLGVARALAEHGVRCIGVAEPFRHPAWKTNTCEVISCPEWSREAVLKKLTEIGESQTRKLPLLVTKELPVRWISDARDELHEFYEISLPDRPVVDRLLNKASFAQLCAQEGWPIPRTWRIRSKEELLSALEEISFPCILKPDVQSVSFGEQSPRKAFKLSDAGELVRTYQMAAQWSEGFVLQEWIHGGDERIAFCLTYVGRDGNSHALFVGRKLRQFPPECGNTALCEPAPPSWRERICALTEEVWRTVRFKGLGSIEFKMREDSGQPVIMEPTVGRTDYQNEVAVLNGMNIPLIAYCDLAGLPRPSLPVPSRTCKLVDGVTELRAARYYFQNGTLTPRKWLQDRRGRCRYMTFRAKDPGPFVASLKNGLRSLAGMLVVRAFGRAAKERLKGAIEWVRRD